MPDRMKINDQITIGAQPSEAELKTMADNGMKTIINLRTEDEDMQRIDPDAEGQLAKKHGLAYVSLPTSIQNAGSEHVDSFRDALEQADKPVFIHCKLGKRAGAFVMMHQAIQQGWSGQQTLDKAQEMGFECENEEMERFVREYVDSKSTS